MKAEQLYSPCRLCPRRCGVDRIAGKTGLCGETAVVRAARAALHMWEEPVISGDHGSGTVFFSGCSLRCIFCQNRAISADGFGRPVTVQQLADIYLSLEAQGAHNINLVTASHFLPHIISSLQLAKSKGLTLPIVYNSGGYESAESLRLLDGLIDIYLPDFKYLSPALAGRFSHAPDYPEAAQKALAEMVRQTGRPVMINGLMQRGVLVRHLVLPRRTHEAMRILDYLYGAYSNNILYSIMGQYTPPSFPLEPPELNRRLLRREYEAVIEHALSLGIQNGYYQQLESAKSDYTPVFDGSGLSENTP